MKNYSKDAMDILVAFYETFEEFWENEDGRVGYTSMPCWIGNHYYIPDEDEVYATKAALIRNEPYAVIKYNFSLWSGYESGAVGYEGMDEYVQAFDIEIPSKDEYEALCEEDEHKAWKMYDDAWNKVIETVVDALYDSLRSCIVRSALKHKKREESRHIKST